MKTVLKKSISLDVYADTAIPPVCTSFVENTARVFGLEQKEAVALALASEEILSYLFQETSDDQTFEITCSGGGYYVRVDFLFSAINFDERAFNLTARISPEDDESLREMGLAQSFRALGGPGSSNPQGKGLLPGGRSPPVV